MVKVGNEARGKDQPDERRVLSKHVPQFSKTKEISGHRV